MVTTFKPNSMMKASIAITAALATCMAAAIPAAAQTDDVTQAVCVLKGMETDGDKARAISTLVSAATRDTSAMAMNALGIAYMKGIGVDADSTQATLWLERAGEAGYHDAYHNLGMMYKDGQCGLRQDFAKAARYFDAGARAGSVMCYYDMGYMLYKGLGCRQDYAKAADLFAKGVDLDHSPCLYMLGLCYRNGYGVERDTARASFLLGRAAELSYGAAIEEQLRELPENSWNSLTAHMEQAMQAPASMPAIEPMVADIASIPGEYQGSLVTYDWSGKYIINERPLSISMTMADGVISGKWCDGIDTVSFAATVGTDGKLIFKEGAMRRHERYTEEHPVLYRFKSADITSMGGSLTGSLRLYSVTQREPERPMYISLAKVGTQGRQAAADSTETRLKAYPNPFSGDVTLSFDLTEDVASARICLYSQTGVNVLNATTGALAAGRHSFTITPNVPDGMYVAHVTAGNRQFRAIIIKKRGAL